MGSTLGKAPAGFAPIATGLGLTLIRLISIPVPDTSADPARSAGPALFAGGWASHRLCSLRAAQRAERFTAGSARNHRIRSSAACRREADGTPPFD